MNHSWNHDPFQVDGVSCAVGSGSAKEVNALIDAGRELVE